MFLFVPNCETFNILTKIYSFVAILSKYLIIDFGLHRYDNDFFNEFISYSLSGIALNLNSVIVIFGNLLTILVFEMQ